MTLSYLSGLLASIITMPMWTVRLRISLLTIDKYESPNVKSNFKYFYLIVKESLNKEGFFKLYKGFFSSVVLSLHGGIQMTIYETGKRYIIKKKNKLEIYQGSLLGSISKIIAGVTLYPFNVIRARQQQFSQLTTLNINDALKRNMILSKRNYGLFFQSIKGIKEANGIKGFYKGLTPSLLRQIPGSSAFFYTYEYILKYLN